jgi:nucleotide-binding universal stress UspA family protein
MASTGTLPISPPERDDARHQVLRHILVATDGSTNGDRAVSYALALGLRHRSDVLLCYAVDHAKAIAECSASNGGGDLLMPLVEDLDAAAESILAEAAKRLTQRGLVAKTVVLDGPSVQAIVACANERGVDAIVMGTQGKNGLERLFLGSTAEGVLRRTDVPVFVVPHGVGEREPDFARIFVAVDESDPSDAAVDFALGLAAADRARLIFCGIAQTTQLLEGETAYAYDPAPMIDELHTIAATQLAEPMERAKRATLACESVVVDGDPADEILRNAAAHDAGLIVLGTHGRRGLRRLFLGSVAESVVRRSTVPVAVVRASSRHAG